MEISTASSASSGPLAVQCQVKLDKTCFVPFAKVQQLPPESQQATSIMEVLANFFFTILIYQYTGWLRGQVGIVLKEKF